MGTSNRIEINPEVMLGKPVIRGTRITVELLLRALSEGSTEADLLDAYPHLTREDIQAAMAYAADTVAKQKPVAGGAAGSKPRTGLFKGPHSDTGHRIGDSDEQPPGDPPWRSS